MEKASLVLSNGAVFTGQRIGACGDTVGELVFTTGVVGYLETLTDPSYAGQIIMHTFPLIGNYGVIEADFEGQSACKGYVVRELCREPSNFRSMYELDLMLKQKGIVGIAGIDTRAITRMIRDEGVMNAKICSEVPSDMSEINAYAVRNVVAQVSCSEIHTVPAQGDERFHVCLIDYGAKKSIIRCLTKRGCRVTVVPYDTPAERIIELAPDGLMLSNGPGDPTDNPYCIEQLKKLIGKFPTFGICLGHQLTALAMGGRTEKLKYGHHGGNQPVKRLSDGRCFITSQNHGYAVVSESMAGKAVLSFVNLDDQSCEGLDYPDKNCFTVQFHPESCSGPHDPEFLFERFIQMMGGNARA